MSIASVTGQVVFTRKAGVYMPSLMCNKGDLYQEYNGDASNPTNIFPDFTSLKPTLKYVITSSREAEGIVTPSSVDWYFKGTKLAFSSSDHLSTTTFNNETGHFLALKMAGSDGVTYFGLRIVKNLVKAADALPCTITAKAKVSVGNTSDEIQCQYNIPITYGVGNSKRVTIMAGDDKYFTLTGKGQSCLLEAVTRVGTGILTDNLTYKWYKLVNSNWVQLEAESGKTLRVSDTMVDTTGQFKVEVYQGSTLIGVDVQTVIDASDPFDIIINPSPENETISDPQDTVSYTPILVKRGETKAYKAMKFYIVFTDSVGNVVNVPTPADTPVTTGVCNYAMCIQASGNVCYTITSEE